MSLQIIRTLKNITRPTCLSVNRWHITHHDHYRYGLMTKELVILEIRIDKAVTCHVRIHYTIRSPTAASSYNGKSPTVSLVLIWDDKDTMSERAARRPWVGIMVSVSASHTVGRELSPRSGHTKS